MSAPHDPRFLRGLLEHGSPTDIQRQSLEAMLETGTQRGAAQKLNRAQSSIATHLKAVRVKAARNGYAPDHDLAHPVPPGFGVKGVSTLYDADGVQRAQWVKTSKEAERAYEALTEAVEAFTATIPRAKPEKPPQSVTDDLAACYVLSDYHLGQLSYGPETGADWDTDLAEEMLTRWFSAAIQSAPKAHTGILAQLGDFMHHDGVALEAITPTSGNILDADTRFQRLVRVAVRSLRRVISMMLKKHQHVHVILAEGNHDISSSVWLREMFSVLYENEPRISVDTSIPPFYAFEWGNTSLFFHHSHKVKINEVSRVFAGMFRELYGRTEYSYAHIGHLHHVESKEDSLMIVERHPTVAARDAHSARGGYISDRGAQQITYSRKHGEVARTTIRPEMVQWENETRKEKVARKG